MAGRRRTPPPLALVRDNGPVGDPGLDIRPVGEGDWVRMMLYSYPSWGKTSLLGTSGALGNTLIIHSSLDLMPARIMKLPGLTQVTCDTWEKMDRVLDLLRMTEHGYTWVWWDCISVAQDVLLDDVWEATIAEKPQRAFKMVDGKRAGPNLTPTSGLDRGEYGRNMERIQQWVRHMVGTNSFHFGITAHPFEGDNQINDEGGVFLQPWIQGKSMISKICGYMNVIAFLELKEVAKDDGVQRWRRLHTQENTRFYAKDLYDALLPKGYMDNPDMGKLLARIEAARGRSLGRNAAPVTAARRGTTQRRRRGVTT
jgi:hypothetical protein